MVEKGMEASGLLPYKDFQRTARTQRFEITEQDILTKPIIGSRQSTGLQIVHPAIVRRRIGLQEIRVTSAVLKRVDIGVDEALILARQSAIGTGGADIVQIGIDRSLVRPAKIRREAAAAQ